VGKCDGGCGRFGNRFAIPASVHKPSSGLEDFTLTHRLVQAGVLLGIELLDHLIIGLYGDAGAPQTR
jgi:hypothetical protein